MRTGDVTYSADYWNSLDGGLGYNDSTMWEDIAHSLKEVFGIRGGQDVSGEISFLDVGCAKGYLIRHMRRRGFESWGTDFSVYAINHSDPDSKPFIRCHDLTTQVPMQWNDGYFGLVSCIETMEHIPEESVAQALAHIRRVSGGWTVFTICTAEHPDPYDDPTHVTIKPREWWENKLVQAGFSLTFAGAEKERALKRFWLFSAHKGVFVCQ